MTGPQQFPTPPEISVDAQVDICEDWIIAESDRVLGSQFKSIESGPGDWSEIYLNRVINCAPAIRVVFAGGQGRGGEELDIDSVWQIFIVTGQRGQSEKKRRRGDGPSVGSYRAMTLLAAWLHNQVVSAEHNVGKVAVDSLGNLWSGDLDKKAVSVVSIKLKIPLHLTVPVVDGDFDQFLSAGVDWDGRG